MAESLLHKFPKLSRKAVLVLLGVVCLGCGIGMETIAKWGPWMDPVSYTHLDVYKRQHWYHTMPVDLKQ